MPIVVLVPRSVDIEDRLADKMEEIRANLKEAICNISGFPSSDVLVNLHFCPYRDADPEGAEVVVFADTCPNEELEVSANLLCDAIAIKMANMGFSAGNGAEIWPRFLPGPWCLVRNMEIVDRVEHPRHKASI